MALVALATFPLAAGYTPATRLSASVLACRVRTPASLMGAGYSGLSYRELQVECKAQGLKATGKTAVLLARLEAEMRRSPLDHQPFVPSRGSGPPAGPPTSDAPPAGLPSPPLTEAPSLIDSVPRLAARRKPLVSDAPSRPQPDPRGSSPGQGRRQPAAREAHREARGHGHDQSGSEPGLLEGRPPCRNLQCPSCRLELSDKGRRRHMAFCCPVCNRGCNRM